MLVTPWSATVGTDISLHLKKTDAGTLQAGTLRKIAYKGNLVV